MLEIGGADRTAVVDADADLTWTRLDDGARSPLESGLARAAAAVPDGARGSVTLATDGSTTGMDGATAGMDGSTTVMDGSTPGTDGSTPGMDGSTPGTDGGVLDGGIVLPDGGGICFEAPCSGTVALNRLYAASLLVSCNIKRC